LIFACVSVFAHVHKDLKSRKNSLIIGVPGNNSGNAGRTVGLIFGGIVLFIIVACCCGVLFNGAGRKDKRENV